MKNQNIEELRIKKGLLQKDLAVLSNISPAFYCLIEKGKRKPSLETAKNISHALAITLDEFYQALIITISQYKPDNKRGGKK